MGGKEAKHAASRAVPEGGGLWGRWGWSPTRGKGLECYLWPTPTTWGPLVADINSQALRSLQVRRSVERAAVPQPGTALRQGRGVQLPE